MVANVELLLEALYLLLEHVQFRCAGGWGVGEGCGGSNGSGMIKQCGLMATL